MTATAIPSSESETVTRGIHINAPQISIGILAWNEKDSIGTALGSLFQQSFFSHLSERRMRCEILCVANACTDNTPQIATEIFHKKSEHHPFKNVFTCRCVHLAERGKTNAWNQFVHSLSAKAAQFLFLMDGDILLLKPDTLWNMYRALLHNPDANVSVDQPVKDIALKPRKSLGGRISLATSRMTQADGAQLTGQLYCIRAAVARNIYLPRDLAACEDGFIKSIVCTDFLTRPVRPGRIVQAPEAAHVFEAYTSVRDIFRNQKRQMIGQTITHVLVDGCLKQSSAIIKGHLASALEEQEKNDPLWLKRVTTEHVSRLEHFWQIFPGVLGFRFQRLGKLHGQERLLHFPAALVGFFVTLLACWAAYRALKQGCTHYWPDTNSPGLERLAKDGSRVFEAETLDAAASQGIQAQ